MDRKEDHLSGLREIRELLQEFFDKYALDPEQIQPTLQLLVSSLAQGVVDFASSVEQLMIDVPEKKRGSFTAEFKELVEKVRVKVGSVTPQEQTSQLQLSGETSTQDQISDDQLEQMIADFCDAHQIEHDEISNQKALGAFKTGQTAALLELWLEHIPKRKQDAWIPLFGDFQEKIKQLTAVPPPPSKDPQILEVIKAFCTVHDIEHDEASTQKALETVKANQTASLFELWKDDIPKRKQDAFKFAFGAFEAEVNKLAAPPPLPSNDPQILEVIKAFCTVHDIEHDEASIQKALETVKANQTASLFELWKDDIPKRKQDAFKVAFGAFEAEVNKLAAPPLPPSTDPQILELIKTFCVVQSIEHDETSIQKALETVKANQTASLLELWVDEIPKRKQDTFKAAFQTFQTKADELNKTQQATPGPTIQQTLNIISPVTSPRTQPTPVVDPGSFEMDKSMLKDISEMPICSEKLVMELICLLSSETQIELPESTWDGLRTQLRSEKLFQLEIETKIREAQNFVNQGKKQDALKLLSQSLKQIRPLDMFEIERLLVQSAKAQKAIQGEKIVLLIGKTGAGKSTTIQALAGGNMKQVKKEISPGVFLDHWEAVPPFPNPTFKEIVSSPESKSETRALTPILVSLPGGEHVWLVDAPGYGDTAGPEVDITNGVAILQTLAKCESVRILALIGRPNLGNRNEGVSDLARVLANMVKGVEDRLGAFSYYFTKFPELFDTNSMLKSLKEARRSQNICEDAVDAIIEDMIDKTTDNPCIFSLDGKNKTEPAKIFAKLNPKKAILNPGENLLFSICESTQASIASFCHCSLNSVNYALQNWDFPLIAYRLSHLHRLSEVIKSPIVRDTYSSCIENTLVALKKMVDEEALRFDRCIQSLDGLRSQDIEIFLAAVGLLRAASKLDNHLKDRAILPSVLTQCIKASLATLKTAVQQKALDDPLVSCYFSNFFMLQSAFPDLAADYNQELQCWNVDLFKAKEKEILLFISGEAFDEVAPQISVLAKASKLLATFFPELHLIPSGLVSAIAQHFRSLVEKVAANFRNTTRGLDRASKECLKHAFELLNRAKESLILSDLLLAYQDSFQKKDQGTTIPHFYGEIIAKTNQYFEQRGNQLKESLRATGAFDEVRTFLQEMEEVRGLHQDLRDSTAAQYFSTVRALEATMNELTKELEDDIATLLTTEFNGKVGVAQYSRISKALGRLKKALDWFDEHSPGMYATIMEKVTEELNTHMLRLKDYYENFDLTLKGVTRTPGQLVTAYGIIKEVKHMQNLEDSIPSLRAGREEILGRFVAQLRAVSNDILKEFNLQDNSVHEFKKELDRLQDLYKAVQQLHPARKKLAESGFDDEHHLRERRAKIEEDRDANLQKIQKDEETTNEKKSRVERTLAELDGQLQQAAKEQGALLKVGSLATVAQDATKEMALLNQQLEAQQEEKKRILADAAGDLHRLKVLEDQFLKDKKSFLFGNDANEMLNAGGFQSIEALNSRIEECSSVIEKGKKTQLEFTFDGLDLHAMENALKYLGECQLAAFVNPERLIVDQTVTEVDNYLKEYGKYLDKEIGRLMGLRFQPKEVRTAGWQLMINLVNQINIDRERFPNVHFRVIQQRNGKEWKQEFAKHLTSLIAAIDALRDESQIAQLRELMEEAYAFSQIDVIFGFVPGFGALYQEIRRENHGAARATCETIQNYIEQNDFKRVGFHLGQDVLGTVSERALTQLREDLERALSRLMRETETQTNILNLQNSEGLDPMLVTITSGLDAISLASSQRTIIDNLPPGYQQKLEEFPKVISKRLEEKMLDFVKTVEALIEGDVFQAEYSINNLKSYRFRLKDHCHSPELEQKCSNLDVLKDKMINQICDPSRCRDIKQYFKHPPKVFLAQLLEISRTQGKYRVIYTQLSDEVRTTFHKEIQALKGAAPNGRQQKHTELTSVVRLLHADFQQEATNMLEEVDRAWADQQKQCSSEIEDALSEFKGGELEVNAIKKQLGGFKEKNRKCFLQLQNGLVQKVQGIQVALAQALEKREIGTATKELVRLLQSVPLVEEINQLKPIIDKGRDSIVNHWATCCKCLRQAATAGHSNQVDRAYEDIIACYEVLGAQKARELLGGGEVPHLKIARDYIGALVNLIKEHFKKFEDALKSRCVTDVYQILNEMSKWSPLVETMKNATERSSTATDGFPTLPAEVNLPSLVRSLVEAVVELGQPFKNFDYNDQDMVHFEDKRKATFEDLNSSLAFLSGSHKLQKFLKPEHDPKVFDVTYKQCKELLDEKVKEMNTRATDLSKKSPPTPNDCDKFRLLYNLLLMMQTSKLAKTQAFLDEYESAFQKKIDIEAKKVQNLKDKDIPNAAIAFLAMKFLSVNLPMFRPQFNDSIDQSLKGYRTKHGAISLSALSAELERKDPELGPQLLADHTILVGEDRKRRREKMLHQDDLDRLLDRLGGDDINRSVLESRYKQYKVTYEALLHKHLMPTKDGDPPPQAVLVTQTKHLVDRGLKGGKFVWTEPFKEHIPEILANIFAVWTLLNTDSYNEARGIDGADKYLLMPHVGQVVAIFRILGVGYSVKEADKGKKLPALFSNLVEVGTGEGKSVILAVTSIFFALTGADVNCSCYSHYLSTRDQKAFSKLFQCFGVEAKIEYGTFNKLCENYLNSVCNLREQLRTMIQSNEGAPKPLPEGVQIPRVLLIDEVDVFLSKDFYGQLYNPTFTLQSPEIMALQDVIWKKRGPNNNFWRLAAVKKEPAYMACTSRYTNWGFLIDEAIKDMLSALQSFDPETATYEVHDDKIKYLYGESLVENMVTGYDTIWAYFYENEKKKISPASLSANVGIYVNCGTFSYAEMPHDFFYITGVSGTLKTLAKPEMAILQKTYDIQKMTYLPSVFADAQREFDRDPEPHTKLCFGDKKDHFVAINLEIDAMHTKAKRPILVFFPSSNELEEFYKSEQFSEIKKTSGDEFIQIITERVSAEDRDIRIKRAASEKKITFLTPTFGRGTDFELRHPQVNANGGIHVLQTFFSQELSEEYQIKGRCARQGDNGSFKLLLLASSLEWVLGSTWETRIKTPGILFYKTLNEERTKLYEGTCASRFITIEQCKKDHEASKKFMAAIIAADFKTIKTFVGEKNKGSFVETAVSRTILLMDATGSMGGLLSAVKDTCCKMFELASTVLKESGFPEDNFKMQFVVYRDYDCKDTIIQSSGWETKAANLRSFMGTISATGGGDYPEAVEIGLHHAAQQHASEQIAQVLLIADAPAKERPAIISDRARYNGESFWVPKYGPPTHYTEQLEKLAGVPVHTFYLGNGTGLRANFEDIAKRSGGTCRQLSMSNASGAQTLTNLVVEEVLRMSAGSRGEEVVQHFKAKYFLS